MASAGYLESGGLASPQDRPNTGGVDSQPSRPNTGAVSSYSTRPHTTAGSVTSVTLESVADETAASIAGLVAAGLAPTDAAEVADWQRAMNDATRSVEEWAAHKVQEEIERLNIEEAKLETSDRTAWLEFKAERAEARPYDTVKVPVHLSDNGEEFLRVGMRWDDTVYELKNAIMRDSALPLRPSLSFNGSIMEPSATLQKHSFDDVWLSFTYEGEQHRQIPFPQALEKHRTTSGVPQQYWKRELSITDMDGTTLALQWNGNELAMNFDVMLGQGRFPMSVKLPSKVLAEVHPAIATCSEDLTARIWDATTGRCELVLRGHSATVNSACFGPGNATVVTCCEDHTVKVWDLSTGDCLHTLEGHTDAVSAAAFSPDGVFLLTYSDDCTAKVWSMQSMLCVFTLSAHSAPVYLARFDDGGTITTVGRDGKMLLWDACTGNYMRALQGPQIESENYSYSPDGRQTVTASSRGEATVWDVATGRSEVILSGHEQWVTQAIFAPPSPAMVAAAEAAAVAAFSPQRTCTGSASTHSSSVLCRQ